MREANPERRMRGSKSGTQNARKNAEFAEFFSKLRFLRVSALSAFQFPRFPRSNFRAFRVPKKIYHASGKSCQEVV